MSERNIKLSKAKELPIRGKIQLNGKSGIYWKAIKDKFINLKKRVFHKIIFTNLKIRLRKTLEYYLIKPKLRN